VINSFELHKWFGSSCHSDPAVPGEEPDYFEVVS
jgi:hypothetical protein